MANSLEKSPSQVRLPGIVCLTGVAATHLMDLKDKVEEAPYMAVMFSGLIIASVVLAVVLACRWREQLAWLSAAGLSASTMLGYVLSRTIGLPQLEDHVGMWLEPAGTASLVFESALVTMGVCVLRRPATVHVAHGRGGRALTAAVLLAAAVAFGLTDAAGATTQSSMPSMPGMAMPEFPDLSKATPHQIAQAKRLLRRSKTWGKRLFPTYGSAIAAGYKPHPDRNPANPFFHVEKHAYLSDHRLLDPRRPESLVFWRRPGGDIALAAFMYRAWIDERIPKLGGPILRWHRHGRGRTRMTHVWFTGDLSTAYALQPQPGALTLALGG